MFSVRQKRAIAGAVQMILREIGHVESSSSEIHFLLHVRGEEAWFWANICNNGAVAETSVNLWNEMQDKGGAT